MATAITRDDVLAAALELLREDGFGGLSMRALAKRLGVSYQVAYSRVGGKDDLVRALHDEAFAALADRVVDVDAEPGTAAHLHAVAQHYLRHAVDDPVRFELMFGRPYPRFERDGTVRDVEWACFGRSWWAAATAYVKAHLPDRPRGTSFRLAMRLWQSVHGIVVLHLAGHRSATDDVAAEVAHVVDRHLDDVLAATAVGS